MKSIFHCSSQLQRRKRSFQTSHPPSESSTGFSNWLSRTKSGKWYYAKIKYVVTPAQTLNWGSGERTRAACRGRGGKVRAPWRKLCSLMLFWLIYWDFLSLFFFLLEGGGGLSSNFTTLWELSVKAQQLPPLYHCLKHLTKHSSMGPLHTCRPGPGACRPPSSCSVLINLNAY